MQRLKERRPDMKAPARLQDPQQLGRDQARLSITLESIHRNDSVEAFIVEGEIMRIRHQVGMLKNRIFDFDDMIEFFG